jgi:outer membrane protein
MIRLHNRYLGLGFFVGCFSLGVHGQAQEAPKSLDDCLQWARQHNLTLRAAQEGLRAKEAKKTIAWRKMLPSLALTSSATSSLTALGVNSNALTLTQPIYHGRTLWATKEVAWLDYQSTLHSTQRVAQELIRDVKKQWYSMLEKQMLERSKTDALGRLVKHAHNARHFFNEGQIWRNDILQAQVEVARGEQTLLNAQTQALMAAAKLNQLLHRDIEAPFTPKEGLAPQHYEVVMKEATAEALSNRPDLMVYHLGVEAQHQAEVLAAASLHPQLDLKASYALSSSDFERYDNQTTVQLTLGWNLWNWGQTYLELDAARANTRQAQLVYEAVVDQIRVEVKQSFLKLEESKKSVEVLHKAMQQARENFRVSEIRYREKLGSANDVLIAQNLLATTEESSISSLGQYLIAIAELQLAMGRDPDLH